MICLYLVVALFSCDLAQSAGVPLWYKEIESLLADEAEGKQYVAVTRGGIQYTGTLSEIQQQLKHGSGEGQYVALDDSINFDDTESVFGHDDRHLQNPDVYPFSAMGRIAKGCTGTFISPHVVLTAGHCVYNYGNFYNSLTIYRKEHCHPAAGIEYKWTVAYFPKRWMDYRERNYDIAWIVYGSPSPVYMPYTNQMPPVGTEISIYGYPADLEYKCLWGSSDVLLGIYSRRLKYKVDTYGGMSGSAVFYNDGGNPVIIGVHAYGFPGRYNSGTRLIKEYTDACDEIIQSSG